MRYKFYKSQSKTTHEFTPQNNVISTASLLQIKVLSHTGGGGGVTIRITKFLKFEQKLNA